jgi:hypothetical protein
MAVKKKISKSKAVKPKKQPKKVDNPNDKRIGNQFWRLRSKHGRDKLFETPQLLWEAACEYFEWCDKHPLFETKAFCYKGKVVVKKLPRLRAMTLSQLCFYLNCSESYLREFKSNLKTENQIDKDFLTVIKEIEQVIYNQKFQGAAADQLNSNIIARDLGLSDKTDSKQNITIRTLADIACENANGQNDIDHE